MARRDELIDQYRQVHASKTYGQTSEIFTGLILKQIAAFPKIERVFDYGCGQARTADWIAKIHNAEAVLYDPAIPGLDHLPDTSADLVLCIDVMEHIPLETVDTVLQEIRQISPSAFFNISCVKAAQILPNGENAHCTVRPPLWWKDRLAKYWANPRQIRSLNPNAVSLVTWPRLSDR